jgi:hypothetical protein
MDLRQGYALTVSIPRNLGRVETEDFRPPAWQGYGLFRQSYPQSDNTTTTTTHTTLITNYFATTAVVLFAATDCKGHSAKFPI